MTVFIVHALAYPAENQHNHVMILHHNRFSGLLAFNIAAFLLSTVGFPPCSML